MQVEKEQVGASLSLHIFPHGVMVAPGAQKADLFWTKSTCLAGQGWVSLRDPCDYVVGRKRTDHTWARKVAETGTPAT